MKWEYKVEVIPFEDIDAIERALNVRGNEGWELIAIIPRVGAGNSWSQAILKRQKSN